ncbi:MAG: type III secretion T3S chaperone [Verrucomicrobia bacterium]|nr:type III secretion T3S chaperone [Verrucomicrobiota bacterium]
MEERQKYPLDQLIIIKKRRLEEAEKVLEQKRKVLAQEEEKLLDLEKKRDEVRDHRDDKLHQFRETIDQGSTIDKIQQMRQYLKLVEEKLQVEEKKVSDQQKVVQNAKQQVEEARQDLFKKQKDVEKLKIHEKEWKKEMDHLIQLQEEALTDEMGSAMFVVKKAKKEPKEDG